MPSTENSPERRPDWPPPSKAWAPSLSPTWKPLRRPKNWLQRLRRSSTLFNRRPPRRRPNSPLSWPRPRPSCPPRRMPPLQTSAPPRPPSRRLPEISTPARPVASVWSLPTRPARVTSSSSWTTSPSSTKSEPPSSETRRRCSLPSEAPKRWSGLTVAWPLCWVKKDSREICPLPKTRAGKPTTFKPNNNNNNIETSTRTSTFPRATYTIEPNRIYSIEKKSTPSKNNNKPKRLDWLGHLFSLPFSLSKIISYFFQQQQQQA